MVKYRIQNILGMSSTASSCIARSWSAEAEVGLTPKHSNWLECLKGCIKLLCLDVIKQPLITSSPLGLTENTERGEEEKEIRYL